MTTATTDTSAEAGRLMRLTAAYLAASGVRVKQDEDLLTVDPVTRPRSKEEARQASAARWTLSVDDDARVNLCFCPWAAETSDPRWLADVAAALLAYAPSAGQPASAAGDAASGSGRPVAGAGEPAPDAGAPDAGTRERDVRVPAMSAIGLKGAVGHELRRRGFTVRLNTHADDDSFELTSDISATTAASDGSEPDTAGTVYISDNGTMFFDRTYWPDPASSGAGAGASSGASAGVSSGVIRPAGHPAVARAIADTVTAAIAAAGRQRAVG